MRLLNLNSNLNTGDFLNTTKQGDGSYLSHENLPEALVGSRSFRVASNLDLEFLEQANVSELKDSFKV